MTDTQTETGQTRTDGTEILHSIAAQLHSSNHTEERHTQTEATLISFPQCGIEEEAGQFETCPHCDAEYEPQHGKEEAMTTDPRESDRRAADTVLEVLIMGCYFLKCGGEYKSELAAVGDEGNTTHRQEAIQYYQGVCGTELDWEANRFHCVVDDMAHSILGWFQGESDRRAARGCVNICGPKHANAYPACVAGIAQEMAPEREAAEALAKYRKGTE